MTDNRIDVSPKTVWAHMDRAEKMRTDALRASMVDFTNAVKSVLYRISHVFSIPRTEQL